MISLLTAGTGDWLVLCAGLFFLTFAHEDLALVAAAFSRVEYGLPLPLAALSVFCGIVASDVFIYSLGRVARRSAWLRRWIIGARVERAGAWLRAHLLRTVALCRITPGLLFPAFVACGWFQVSALRFLAASLFTAAVYTPLVLWLLTLLGTAVLQTLGLWVWGLLFAALLTLTLRNAVRAFSAPLAPGLSRHRHLRGLPHKRAISLHGMPSLASLRRKVAQAEHIPSLLFYLPLVVRWLALGLRYRSLTLPALANPGIEMGGFWGESKQACMDLVGGEQRRWLADYRALRRSTGENTLEADLARASAAMREAGLVFPVVAKPDIGWQGFGVQLLADRAALRDYLAHYPAGEYLLLQRPVPYDGEAGVFYARLPGEANGRVFSLALRYFPYVTGDGRSTLQDLILKDARTHFKSHFYLGGHMQHLGLAPDELNGVPGEGVVVRLAFIGSIRVGGLYRDGRQYITPALTRRFDAIAQSMPEFYFGRFDIRFKSLEALQAGEDFAIIEINGAGSEAIHVWDPEMSLLQTYRGLCEAQSLFFRIAEHNRARGYTPPSLREFYTRFRDQQRLIRRYPPSA